MVKRWQVAIGVVLILVLMMMACAPSAAPEPGAKSAVKIEILTTAVGGQGYVMGYGLSDLINKYSPWLQATVVETAGSVENVLTLAKEPAKRNMTVVYAERVTMAQAERAETPFDQPYTTLKVIGRATDNPWCWATLDPNIKTPADLVGKRLAAGPPAVSWHQGAAVVLDHGYGILDEVTLEPLGFEAAKDALMDGLVDAAILGSLVELMGTDPAKPEKIAPIPATIELIERASPYWIDISQEAIDKTRAATGWPLTRVEAAPLTFGPNQTKPLGVPTMNFTWAVDAEMPDDIVYEIERIMYEHAAEFINYHAAGASITPDTIGTVLGTTEADFHPAAVKFFKEKGIRIGD